MFKAWLLPINTGVPRLSAASSSFIALLLVFCSGYAWGTTPLMLEQLESDAMAAVLLLVPGALAAASTYRSKHSLTTRLLFDTRLTVVISTVMLLVVSLSLTLRFEKFPLALTWSGGAAFIAVTCALRLIIQHLRLPAYY